ncbi:MAG: hypothetical protein ABSA90_13775 [Xanthobacteraceae bacterium]|jgi:hypothetical protein
MTGSAKPGADREADPGFRCRSIRVTLASEEQQFSLSRKEWEMPTHSWKILLTIAFGLSSTSALASSACDSVKFSIHLDVKDLTECIGDLQLENQTNEMAIDALMKENDYFQGYICTLATEIAQRDTSDASAASFASIMCSHPKPKQRPKQNPAKSNAQQK